MTMQRPVRLITSMLIVSIFLPIILTLWLSHRQVHELFIQKMDGYTERVLARTQRVEAQTQIALSEVNHFKGLPCSEEHLRLIQKVSYLHQYIQDIFYLQRVDTSCRLQSNTLAEKVPGSEFIAPGGYRVWLTSQHDSRVDDSMVAISRGKYVAIISPNSLIDILPSSSNPIYAAIISTRGHRVIASNHSIDPNIWQSTLRAFRPKQETDGYVYEQHRLPLLGAILLTWSTTNPIQQNWLQQLMLWLPFGLVLSGLAIFMLRRVLRRLQSPHYRILDAIKSGEIMVHYQPIVELKSGRVTGAEALARWQQADGQWLPPNLFIPLAEESGIITPLTEHIVRCVFNDMGHWLAQHPDLHISVNIAAADLDSPTLPALINQQIQRWHILPHQIAIELTERSLVDPKEAIPVLQAYRELGHAIYIDDFGVGYSNISYLQELEVDTIKIDKSFVDMIECKPVATHIIEMAKALNLSMVAEGIETQLQRNWLVAHGVQSGQGWLFSKPLSKRNFVRWAQDNLNQVIH